MERRLLTFIIASTAFFFVYTSLRIMFVPPEVIEAPGLEVVPEGDNVGDTLAENTATGGQADTASSDPSATEASRPPEPSWLTLGSMAPESGYHMLVTLNSRGAGIERIELTERGSNGKLRYRRVDTLSGYLGYFAGVPAVEMDGVRVNVVGPGTPADLAVADGVTGGIRPGDTVIAVAGRPVSSPGEIRSVLEEIKPGREITVEVERPDRPIDAEEASKTTTSLVFTATLSDHPLDLVRLAKTGGEDQVTGNLNRLSSLLTLGKVNRKNIRKGERAIDGIPDATGVNWNVQATSSESENEAVEFVVRFSDAEMSAIGGQAVGLRRSFELPKESYALSTTVEVTNEGAEPQELAYRLEGFNGITLEGWWYSTKISPNWGGSAARDVIYKTKLEGHELVSGYALLKRARNTPEDADQNLFAEDQADDARNLKYIGIDAQYFDVAYLPPEGKPSITAFRRGTADIVADPTLFEKHKDRAVNASFYLDSKITTLAAGESMRQELQIFAGPKTNEILEQYGLSDALYYGWFWFIAKPLGNLLHGLFWIVKNYALAIILLTVLVRGLMFPLSRKAAVNAQRMQELAPELKKIGEKYKDDMEGRLKAQRALQQRVGFNPMAGCLPMFMQLPIFVGLYRSLSVDIELRQAAFAAPLDWASNLSAPDQFLFWGDWLWGYLSGRGNGWLGPYLNILPLVVMLLFLVQQKMFMPPATDEQTAMTQKMMSWMTLVMGLFFFRVPAGLCLYFVTSSLWGICERIIVKKTLPTGKHFDEKMLAGGAGGVGVIDGVARPAESKSKSLSDRVREKLNPPEAPRERPNKRKRPGGGKKK